MAVKTERAILPCVGSGTDDLDEDGAERPRLPWAVMDRRSRPGPEPTTLEAVRNQWSCALVVVQAGEEEEGLGHPDTLWALQAQFSKLHKNFLIFF